MTMLRIERLLVEFDGRNVISDFSCQVPSGNSLGIKGSNGSGKSTIAKAIFGLIVDHKGKVSFDGIETPANARSVYMSYMPQGRGTFGNMTVCENLKLAWESGDQADEWKVTETYCKIAFSEIARNWDRRTLLLSGGQARLISFVRAVVMQKPVLLLDEPTAGLSDKLVDSVIDTISTLKAQGKHVIIFEQNEQFLESVCDKVVSLK